MGNTVTKTPADRYVVRAGHEWAFIFVDEQSGTFSTVSSFGNWGYTWTARGSQTLKQFLAGLDFHYFFGKVDEAHHGRAFDFEASIANIKNSVIEQRKHADITRELAREVWERVISLERCDSEDEFYRQVYDDHTIAGEFYQWDVSGLAVHTRHPQCVGFWEKLWPVFIAFTQQESP